MGWNKKKIENALGAFGFRLFQRWVSRKSPLGAERTGERLGNIAFRIMKSRRNRTLNNLRLAFPELSEEERLTLARGTFQHFGRVTADFLRATPGKSEEIMEAMEVKGAENIDAALAKGKGALLITGHFGNWERIGHWLTASGYKTTAIARDPGDREISAMVLRQREAAGLNVLSRGNAARGMLSHLKQNETIGILFDQNSEEAFIPFFGHPCGTVLGPAVISLRSGAPLVPMFCCRTGPNRYYLEFLPAVEPAEGFEGPEAYARSMNAFLEAAIRRFPDQYLWLHDRWKSARKRGLV